jgi:hypothetical protein
LIDHYKWSWDVFDKLKRRIEHYKTLPGVDWWTESVAFLDHIAANDGRIDVSRPDLQCQQLHGRSDVAFINAQTLHSPFIDEDGNVEPNSCGNPIKQCPSKIQRRRRPRRGPKTATSIGGSSHTAPLTLVDGNFVDSAVSFMDLLGV